MSVIRTVMATLKAKAPVGLALLASLGALSCLSPMQPAYADPASQQAFNQFIAGLGTTQLGAGTSFTQTLSLTSAGSVTLSWKTTTPNTVFGHWSVTNKQNGGSSLVDGYTAVPGAGQVAQFSIDFTKIAPQQVPDSSSPQYFYVTVQPVNAAHKGLAPQSNAVTIVYAQAK